jgi:hypothetical protein
MRDVFKESFVYYKPRDIVSGDFYWVNSRPGRVIIAAADCTGYLFHWGNTPDMALGTSVLYLIPGVPLINSIMDIIDGHVLAGTSRFINACLLIICIAIGLSITLLITGVSAL